MSGSTAGIYFASSNDNNVSNSTGISNAGDGFYLAGNSNNNAFTKVAGISNISFGMYIYGSSGNTVADSALASYSGKALVLSAGTSNTARNNTMSSGNGLGTLLQADSGNNTICLNNFTATAGLYIDNYNSNNAYNCTYAGQNQGNIYPNVMSGAVAVQGNVSSVSFPQLYVGRNGTGYPYGPATSQGKMINATDYAPLTPFYFNNSTAACVCGTPLSTPNYVCNVTSDLNSIGTCFSVNATNVTILCNGHSISGSISQGYGVYSASAGTKVQNCAISNFSSAIYFNGADNGTVSGTAAATTATYGNAIRLENGADGNAIIGTNATSASGHGIYISSSSGNVITGSSGATLTGAGIFLSSSAGNAINNSRGTSNSGTGILVSQGAGGNTISNSNGTSNGTGNAIELSDSLNNSIANCVGASAGGNGLQILYGANNIISNSKGTSATAAPKSTESR